MSGRVCIALFLLLASISVCLPQASSDRPSGPPLLYAVAPEFEPLAWIQGGERFPRGATLHVEKNAISKPLLPKFFSSADASVSFDGKRVLFAGKQRTSDHWQVWEMVMPAGAPRQVTDCDDDCVRPIYLPADHLVYARKVKGAFALHIASLSAATERPLQITHTRGNFLPADVLRDGRILFGAAQPLGDVPELYTVYTDGSGIESYRCDHGHARYAGRQISSGDIVFSRGGSLYRFTSAVAHEVAVPSPAGIYAGDVLEMVDGSWLASSHAPGERFFALRRWNPASNNSRAQAAKTGVNVVQPVLLAAHPVPNRHPSGLHEWTYANLLCLNAYTSKYKITDGAIASVRLYTQDRLGAARLLGSSTVEKDGSFYLRVPGDQPLKIELLDTAGATLQKELGWFWVRSGEQRICVGCHTGPETAPENIVPAVLLRSTVAADLTAASTSSPGEH